MHRQLYPRKLQWDTKNISISNDSSIDSASTNPDWLPLKAKLEKCNMEKFFFYWFEHQAELSWERIKSDKEQFNKMEIGKHKYFMCRAKKLIKNIMIYANEKGVPCKIKDRPQNIELLVTWQRDLDHTSSLLYGLILDEVNRKGILLQDKKNSTIKFQKFCEVVNKLVQNKYNSSKK